MTESPSSTASAQRRDQPLVLVSGLRKVFGEPETPDAIVAVDNVSFEIHGEETFGLVGESGSGKSTIARTLLRLEEASAGSLIVVGINVRTAAGNDLRRLRRTVQMVFQDPISSLNPRQNVSTLISGPLRAHRIGSRTSQRERVRDVAQLVGLAKRHLDRRPRELSGGECQRVAIARSIVIEPRLIVLDEAVTALDLSMRSQILNLLRDLQSRLGLSYLFISHDLAVVRYMSDRIGVMQQGKIVETASRDALFDAPSNEYTQELLAAVLEPPRPEKRRRIDSPAPLDAQRQAN